MNDDDVITAVREPFATVRMTTPLEAVTARGRSIRRHRLQAVTGAVAAAVAAVVALAISAASPGTQRAPVS